MHVVLFHVIYCITSGAQRLIGPRGNTYPVDQRSRVLTVVLCGTSYLAYGHLGFWGAVLLCSTDSREVQQKGFKSTRSIARQITKARKDISILLPAEEVCLAEENEIYCYATLLGDKKKHTIYSDLTGRFPVDSYDEKKAHFYCVHVQTQFYFYDCNERPQEQEHDRSI